MVSEPFIRDTDILQNLPGLRQTPYTTMYKDGKAYRMRADAYHLPRYLARGFTLEPPKRIEEEPIPPQVEHIPQAKPVENKGLGKNVCGICGKKCKNLPNHITLAHSNNGG